MEERIDNVGTFLGYMLGVVVAICLYFLPAILARHRRDFNRILIINFIFGWTFLGWIVALIWAVGTEKEPVVINNQAPKASTADQLEKLASLKEKGLLTQEEFEAQKKQILA
jgi:predicted membrane protein